jgi:hypothetical protein
MYKVENRTVRILLSLLICSFGFSLIHCRFHDLLDVIGAVAFAFAEIALYHFISLRFGEKTVAATALMVSISSMIVLSLIYTLEFHVWLAFYGLLGTIFSLGVVEDEKKNDWPQKFLAFIVSIFLITLVYFVFKKLDFYEPFLSEIKFALFPIIAILSANARFPLTFRC